MAVRQPNARYSLMPTKRRALLLRLTKYLMGLMLAGLLFVLADYSIDFRPPNIHANYHFSLNSSKMPFDQPVWLRQDNLSILLIRRSPNLRAQLKNSILNLQDADSESSQQPQYAGNALRSRNGEYFVSFGVSTDLTCPLELLENQLLGETCGNAQYDFAGRALMGENQFQNLSIPDYNFNDDFSLLTISIN